MRASRFLSAALAGALALAAVAVASDAAHGAEGQATTTNFATPSLAPIAFGDDWLAEATIILSSTGAPVASTDGTVDVYVSGLAGAYATGVPIQAGGTVYLSQPDAQPPLAAGSYNLSAVFVPAPGSNFITSQTIAPLALTVDPLDAVPAARVVEPDVPGGVPSVELSITGSYVESKQAAPAGDWSVRVISPTGDEDVFTTAIAQPVDPAPLLVPIDSELRPGVDYMVVAEFIPAATLAGGLTVTPIPEITLSTPPAGAFDWAVAPVALPLPALIAAALALLLLVIAAGLVPLLTHRSRRPVEADQPVEGAAAH